jgi:hypothetical protein
MRIASTKTIPDGSSLFNEYILRIRPEVVFTRARAALSLAGTVYTPFFADWHGSVVVIVLVNKNGPDSVVTSQVCVWSGVASGQRVALNTRDVTFVPPHA